MHSAKRQAMRERPPRTIGKGKLPPLRPYSVGRTIFIAAPSRRLDPETAREGEW